MEATATIYEGGAAKKRVQRGKKVSKFNIIEQKKDLRRFKKKLGSIGLIVKQVGGDGNCLFRAVADQLDGDQSKQEKYRQDAVKYIKENPEYFEPFIRGDPKYEESKTPIEDYCAHMSKSTTWGG
jgi:OTU domain-containing protein 3